MAASSSELNPIVIELKRLIPKELFDNKSIGDIRPPWRRPEPDGSMNDMFIDDIKYGAIAIALAKALNLKSYESSINNIAGFYTIRLDGELTSKNLLSDLQKLDTKKTQDEITKLFIENSMPRFESLLKKVRAGAQEHGIYDLPPEVSGELKFLVQTLTLVHPSTLDDINNARILYDKLSQAYETCKKIAMQGPKPKQETPAESKLSSDQKASVSPIESARMTPPEPPKETPPLDDVASKGAPGRPKGGGGR